MNELQFYVDSETCTACESCVNDCPPGVMTMQGELPVINDEQGCMQCQHCFAVCPTGAISILGKKPAEALSLKGNLPSFEQMQILIKGRRSVRHFKQKNIDRDNLQRLLDTVWHAPTGHNSQSMQLTLVDDFGKMLKLSAECFRRLQQLAADNQIPQGQLGDFFNMGLNLHKEYGLDIFFRGAPHMLIASAPKESPSPLPDTMISLSYFELAAQSMGLGTLWNGLAKALIRDVFPDISQRLGVPNDHYLGYVMVFGKPAVSYQRTVERGPARVHIADLAQF
ncbi:nitroreductase family protein [Desulfopila aestuarii]|uniref:Nitroreductase n=1 Tax=Desulfopila aestuarii DSM 18488 TaxID=1121416 RepID=A0A1M7YIY9_9BACT|nr:nitroreductase family protein [Desulfopila aestuarii]SHO52583.1 Nitroreductase [Desulfopila aestuarii DSM 18488]